MVLLFLVLQQAGLASSPAGVQKCELQGFSRRWLRSCTVSCPLCSTEQGKSRIWPPRFQAVEKLSLEGESDITLQRNARNGGNIYSHLCKQSALLSQMGRPCRALSWRVTFSKDHSGCSDKTRMLGARVKRGRPVSR